MKLHLLHSSLFPITPTKPNSTRCTNTVAGTGTAAMPLEWAFLQWPRNHRCLPFSSRPFLTRPGMQLACWRCYWCWNWPCSRERDREGSVLTAPNHPRAPKKTQAQTHRVPWGFLCPVHNKHFVLCCHHLDSVLVQHLHRLMVRHTRKQVSTVIKVNTVGGATHVTA